MREIKFRGIHLKTGKWVYGNFVLNGSFTSFASFFIAQCVDGEVEYFEINPKSLGQYTGLKDKNGKEIYEGDILKFEGLNKAGLGRVAVVEYKAPEFFTLTNAGTEFPEYRSNSMGTHGEVIGNIYENPELLSKNNQGEK